MRAAGSVDVMVVSLGSTAGLRAADELLAGSLRRGGASVAVARADAPAPTRTLMLTDLAWARSARAAARRLLAQAEPRAVIYSTSTAALLWPRPGAIRFDALSAANRPGRHGLWQRPLERRRLACASMLLPWSSTSLSESAPHGASTSPGGAGQLVLPVPVEPSGELVAQGARDIAAITYAANPRKKGLDRVLGAWRAARESSPDCTAELLVAGASAAEIAAAGIELGGERGVRVVGPLPAGEYRALLRRARLFVCAPRREDYGIAQLEALADGCRLLSTPAPGPYAALPIARELDARLVGEDLAGAIGLALARPDDTYAERARAALAPFTPAAVDAVVAEQLLPRLLA
jgi:glycosyltransferase involved in cell wall biosynthesis